MQSISNSDTLFSTENKQYHYFDSNIIDLEMEFLSAYNDAYRCYLNRIPPIIFMHSLLEKIIKLTNSSFGYITSIQKMSNKFLSNIEAYCKDKINTNIIENFNLDTDEIYLSVLETSKMKIINGDNYHNIQKYCYVCIPLIYKNEIIGVLGLYGKSNLKECISELKTLADSLAFLCNSYFKLKLCTDISNDKKVVTYQLLDEILNTINSGIIIVNTNYDIIHTNMYANNLLNNINKNEKPNIIKIFPELNELVNCSIFKNRRIEITTGDNKSKMLFEFIFNTVICEDHFYHIVNICSMVKPEKNCINDKCLIAFLSHELRNPLQSITLANYLIKINEKMSDVQVLYPKITSYLEIINRSCCDMKKIINDILDLSRIESQELLIEFGIYNISDIVDSIMEENETCANERNIQLEKHITENVPTAMYTDITRVTQILNNLISNAIKYSNGGKVTLKIIYDEINNDVKFSVIDQGVGIKKEEISNLFKAYGQTSNSKKNLNSQGLGLCISQKIANLIGGRITVRSEQNKGSTFSFYHPIKLGISRTFFDCNTIMEGLTGNVLLVDDNTSNLTLLHTLLEQFNYEHKWIIKVESTNCGENAIELCKINNYNVIFLDINMGGIDGCTTCKIIKKNGFNGKIVATTGNILSIDENKEFENTDCYKYFDDIIIKPFDDQIVIKTLKKYLAKNY